MSGGSLRRRGTTVAATAGAVVAVLATAVVTNGARGPGVVLYRDDVQVPHPVWNDAALGLGVGPPRAVPYTGVLAALSWLMGAASAQRVVLVAPLLLAGVGVGVLLRRHGAPASMVGALAAVWNPYVAERLGLGQAPTLLAYGALPWLVVAAGAGARGRGEVGRDRSPPRVLVGSVALCTVAFLPAALTPVGAVTGLVVLGAALVVRARRADAVVAGLVGPLLLCSTWLMAALVSGTTTAPAAGADAYAVRDDTGLGTVWSTLTLGGVWAPAASPPSRAQLATVVASAVVLALAGWGWYAVGRRNGGWLAAAWLLPVAAAALAATPVALRWYTAAQGVPGAPLVRDTHRLLAPSALAVAVGVGLGAGQIARWARRRVAHEALTAATALATGATVAIAAAVLLTVPDLPARVAVQYRPTRLPQDWATAVAVVNRAGGTVLSMPWQPLRRTDWNSQRPFLDPLDRAVRQHVVSSRRLQVQRGTAVLVTDTDAEGSAAWVSGELDPHDLARRGVTWVFEYRGTPGAQVRPTPGLRLVREGPAVRLWHVDGAVDAASPAAGGAVLSAAWWLSGIVTALALAALLTRWVQRADERLRRKPTSG